MVILEAKYGMMEIPRLNKKLMAYNLLALSLSHDNTAIMKLNLLPLSFIHDAKCTMKLH